MIGSENINLFKFCGEMEGSNVVIIGAGSSLVLSPKSRGYLADS